jgi:hypothetical protein
VGTYSSLREQARTIQVAGMNIYRTRKGCIEHILWSKYTSFGSVYALLRHYPGFWSKSGSVNEGETYYGVNQTDCSLWIDIDCPQAVLVRLPEKEKAEVLRSERIRPAKKRCQEEITSKRNYV